MFTPDLTLYSQNEFAETTTLFLFSSSLLCLKNELKAVSILSVINYQDKETYISKSKRLA